MLAGWLQWIISHVSVADRGMCVLCVREALREVGTKVGMVTRARFSKTHTKLVVV